MVNSSGLQDNIIVLVYPDIYKLYNIHGQRSVDSRIEMISIKYCIR